MSGSGVAAGRPGEADKPGQAGKAAKSTKARTVPVWARKSNVVLLITLLALAAFGTTTQTWMTATLDPNQVGQAAATQNAIQVQGSKAATTVTALALVALAGGLAAEVVFHLGPARGCHKLLGNLEGREGRGRRGCGRQPQEAKEKQVVHSEANGKTAGLNSGMLAQYGAGASFFAA